MTQAPVQKADGPNEIGAKNTVQLVYILQGVGFFVGVPWIAGVIVNHVKARRSRGQLGGEPLSLADPGRSGSACCGASWVPC